MLSIKKFRKSIVYLSLISSVSKISVNEYPTVFVLYSRMNLKKRIDRLLIGLLIDRFKCRLADWIA